MESIADQASTRGLGLSGVPAPRGAAAPKILPAPIVAALFSKLRPETELPGLWISGTYFASGLCRCFPVSSWPLFTPSNEIGFFLLCSRKNSHFVLWKIFLTKATVDQWPFT